MSDMYPFRISRPRTKSPSVSPLLSLPFDIECAILDQVSHDFVALRACTLVCRAWAPLAQQRLFRSVSIDLEPEPSNYRQNCNPKELQRFLDFLDRTPRVASVVLEITIYGGSIPSLAGFIRATLPRAPRLRSIVVSFMTLDPKMISQVPPLDALVQGDGPSPRAVLDMLEISWCEFNGAKSLFDILRLFSRIRLIRVWSCDVKSGADDTDALDLRLSTGPLVESVVLDTMHIDSPSILQSALSMSSLPAGSLTAVRLKITRQTDLEGFLIPCLHGARDHLRTLHLDLDRRLFAAAPGIGLTPWNPLVDCIASCTALEALTFVVEGKNQFRVPYMNYLRDVLPAYARLVSPSPPSVRSITFKVHAGDKTCGYEDEDANFEDEPVDRNFEDYGVKEVLEAIAEGTHWRTMDTELAGQRALARCAFVFYNTEGHPAPEDRDRIASTLQGVLPWLVKRGVLAVEMKPPVDSKASLYEI